MPSPSVTVVAEFKSQPGREAALREVLRSLLSPTRGEEGCLNYDLHEAADDPSRFLFHENWTSKAALDRHLQSAHVTGALAQLDTLVAEPPKITLWTRIE